MRLVFKMYLRLFYFEHVRVPVTTSQPTPAAHKSGLTVQIDVCLRICWFHSLACSGVSLDMCRTRLALMLSPRPTFFQSWPNTLRLSHLEPARGLVSGYSFDADPPSSTSHVATFWGHRSSSFWTYSMFLFSGLIPVFFCLFVCFLIWNRVDCRRSEKNLKTHKNVKTTTTTRNAF